MSTPVIYATKEDLAYAATVQKRVFAAKEEGKSLVSDTEIEKLASVSANAQENVIEKITVNGEETTVNGKTLNVEIPDTSGFQTAEQVEQAINEKLTGVYTFKGSTTFAALPTTGNVAGYVYNVTDAFTTTNAFSEGAGVTYPAGTNVAWTVDEKWDCMSGIYDFSDFLKVSDIGEISESDIDEMYANS